MADQQLLDLLKQGVYNWNQWRREHLGIRLDLSEADLSGVNLSGADLSGAKLNFANLSDANLSGVDLSGAYIWRTVFAWVDLRTAKGLDRLVHEGPSIVDINCVVLPQGDVLKSFLRGTGFPDTLIEYLPSLLHTPIQYQSCFISYSSKDEAFADRLYADLQSNGVRCWFAPEDMKIGDKIRSRIDEAIRLHDKLLLVLSEYSVESTWVEKEIETAFEKEHQQRRLVLFPIRLDGTVMQTSQAWAADIRRMRHIGDFTKWKEHDEYQKAFSRLLRDLKAEEPRRL